MERVVCEEVLMCNCGKRVCVEIHMKTTFERAITMLLYVDTERLVDSINCEAGCGLRWLGARCEVSTGIPLECATGG